MSEEDIGRVTADFANAARLAQQGGFDALEIHLGLVGMRERAAKVGARLDVTSSPRGSTISVTWGDQ